MLARPDHEFLQSVEIALSACTGVQVTRFATGVTVKSSGPDGFDITVMAEDGLYILQFDNWTEEFLTEEPALRTFAAALAGEARLRVDTLGGRRWRWTLEIRDRDGQWRPESTIGHVTWRLWGRQASLHLRNAFAMKAAEATAPQPARAS